MMIIMAFSKIASSISLAINEPAMEPITAGIPKRKPFFEEIRPAFLKFLVAVRVCKVMAILLVPLATLAGNPINIRSEREMIEPPPASVLMNPTINPAPIRAAISYHVISLNISTTKEINIFLRSQTFCL